MVATFACAYRSRTAASFPVDACFVPRGPPLLRPAPSLNVPGTSRPAPTERAQTAWPLPPSHAAIRLRRRHRGSPQWPGGASDGVSRLTSRVTSDPVTSRGAVCGAGGAAGAIDRGRAPLRTDGAE